MCGISYDLFHSIEMLTVLVFPLTGWHCTITVSPAAWLRHDGATARQISARLLDALAGLLTAHLELISTFISLLKDVRFQSDSLNQGGEEGRMRTEREGVLHPCSILQDLQAH